MSTRRTANPFGFDHGLDCDEMRNERAAARLSTGVSASVLEQTVFCKATIVLVAADVTALARGITRARFDSFPE